MSIDKDLLDQPMEGRAPGDSFGKEGVPAELTKALHIAVDKTVRASEPVGSQHPILGNAS